jgi:hypothetical protein
MYRELMERAGSVDGVRLSISGASFVTNMRRTVMVLDSLSSLGGYMGK